MVYGWAFILKWSLKGDAITKKNLQSEKTTLNTKSVSTYIYCETGEGRSLVARYIFIIRSSFNSKNKQMQNCTFSQLLHCNPVFILVCVQLSLLYLCLIDWDSLRNYKLLKKYILKIWSIQLSLYNVLNLLHIGIVLARNRWVAKGEITVQKMIVELL